MNDLEALLRASRPVLPARQEHQHALEERLRDAASPRQEGFPMAALLLPLMAGLLFALSLREPQLLVPPEARLAEEWKGPSEGLQPMAWMNPKPVRRIEGPVLDASDLGEEF